MTQGGGANSAAEAAIVGCGLAPCGLLLGGSSVLERGCGVLAGGTEIGWGASPAPPLYSWGRGDGMLAAWLSPDFQWVALAAASAPPGGHAACTCSTCHRQLLPAWLDTVQGDPGPGLTSHVWRPVGDCGGLQSQLQCTMYACITGPVCMQHNACFPSGTCEPRHTLERL